MNAKEQDIPTTEQLAVITAHLLGVSRGDVKSAAAKAMEIWDACSEEVALRGRRSAERAAEDKLKAEVLEELKRFTGEEGFPQPQKDKMTLAEVLQTLLPNVKPEDRFARLRRYLAWRGKTSKLEAAEEIKRLKRRTYTVQQYRSFGLGYTEWWSQDLRETRAAANRSRQRKAN